MEIPWSKRIIIPLHEEVPYSPLRTLCEAITVYLEFEGMSSPISKLHFHEFVQLLSLVSCSFSIVCGGPCVCTELSFLERRIEIYLSVILVV